MKSCAFFRFCIIQCIYLSITSLSITSFLHIYLQKIYIDCRRKLHSTKLALEIWGCILEALMKNLHFYTSVFWVWRNLNIYLDPNILLVYAYNWTTKRLLRRGHVSQVFILPPCYPECKPFFSSFFADILS